VDYVCLLDESESDAGAPDRFFVFGGALIPVAKINELHDGIVRIRTETGLPEDAPFKWHMVHVPGVTQKALDHAKSRIPALANACGIELFASPVLREIAVEKKRVGEAYVWGANTIFSAVGKILTEREKRAYFLLDRIPLATDVAFDFLGDTMAHGLGKPNSQFKVHRSVGFGFIDSDCTRIGSALDICLGLFTRCLNDTGNAPWVESGRAVCALLSKDGRGHVNERGVLARPTRILKQYHPAYTRMWERLRALGVSP
jgi:hypothetical protein